VTRAAVLAALMLAAAPAAAQEHPLDVPVRVADLHPSVSVGSVTCALFADPDGPTNNLGYLGSGSKWFQLKDGAYAGTLTVPIRIAPQAVPRSYKCALFVIYKEEGKTLTAAASRISDANRTEYRAPFRRAPGSPFSGEVSGTLGR
jgi:hypothetical protein